MQTHKTFLSLQIFFNDLDVIAKNLFDYFKDTQQNEFEAFETKAIPVNSIAETIQGFKKGKLNSLCRVVFCLTPQQMSDYKTKPYHLNKLKRKRPLPQQ